MKQQLAKLFLFSQKIKPQHIKLALSLFAITMFVIGAGAPDDGGFDPR